MAELSDPELIFLAQQGDKAAFGQLVLRYQPMVQRIAKRAIGNEDLAQELVQDTMLQAYLSLEKLHDPKRFKSWLYGILLNICRNDLRRRKVICFSLEAMVGDLAAEPLRLYKARHQLRERLSPLQDRIQPTSLQEIQTMTTNTSTQIQSELCCSFCGKSNKQVSLLIAGPLLENNRIYICNECVDVCNKIISAEIPPLTQEEVEALTHSGEINS